MREDLRMHRIIVIGAPGSGKSTLSVKLREKTGLPLWHLDNIWWKPDRTHITREAFDERLAALLKTDAWIIDGSYSRTFEPRIKACDTVILLVSKALRNAWDMRARTFRGRNKRSIRSSSRLSRPIGNATIRCYLNCFRAMRTSGC